MKSITKILIGLIIISLIATPTSLQFVQAENEKIMVTVKEGTITITTDYITMKLVDGKPQFIWWNGNHSTADEMYNVQYTTLQEYFGDDSILDSKNELNGLNYNLITSDWVYDIIEGDDEATITMTLDDLANGAELQFIVHIYNDDQLISGTEEVVNGLEAVKFDIIVKNWQFTEGAQGIGLKAQILESQKRHRVTVRNSTIAESDNHTRKMQFVSQEHGNEIVAYYGWTDFADIYNDSVKISTIDVGTAYFDESDQGQGSGVDDPGMIHQWLTYPNYNDSLTMVHDPFTGINPDAFTAAIPLYILPIIGGLISTTVIIGISAKKRK
ncbi:MAG: hypothetical protein GF308_11420 [Candidatus Heimdallarchaeota archaeon]|nr:hypothetical protein [Candidatus Heimdallarchaeota archaeon]